MTEIRATQGFSLFFAQPKSTYINLLMWIQLQLRLYPRFDNVCTHTKPLKGYKAEIV